MTTPNHTDRAHAPFSPSQIKLLKHCAGYHGKDETSDAAEMGTRIHEALEIRDPQALHNEEEHDIYMLCTVLEDALLAGTGVPVEELVTHREIQLDIALDGTATWGTCDRLDLFPCGSQALLMDYKTGIVPVDPPEKNEQAIAYTIGVFQRFPTVEKVHFAFIIPQGSDKTPTHTFTRDDLPELIRHISDVIKAAEAIRPKWDTGTPELEEITPTQYCRFCRHEDRCPALGGLVVSVYRKLVPDSPIPDVDFNNVDDPATVEKLYLIAKIVEAWGEKHRRRAVEMAKAGVVFPSLKLKSMGATSEVTDNEYLLKIAGEFGVTEEEALELAKFPLGELTDLVASKITNKPKTHTKEKFLDTLNDAGIIEKGEPRFTLS
jgi:hypothetical protein